MSFGCPFEGCSWEGDEASRHEYRATVSTSDGIAAALARVATDYGRVVDQAEIDWQVEETTRHLNEKHPGWKIRDLRLGAAAPTLEPVCPCECHLHYTVHHVEPCCPRMVDGDAALPPAPAPRTLDPPQPVDAWVMPASPTIVHKPGAV